MTKRYYLIETDSDLPAQEREKEDRRVAICISAAFGSHVRVCSVESLGERGEQLVMKSVKEIII